ncbi:MAG: TRAP transporter small permease [Deltaproteobacteria bacterium]|nr:TRAP transporter small permease [Deltaproteobacteria bacterium]
MLRIKKIGVRFERAMHCIGELLIWLPVAALFTMMLLAFCDVIARDLFSSPIKGAQDIIEALMVLTIFLAAPYARKSIIRVDVILSMFSKKVESLVNIITSFVSAGVLSLVAWQLSARAIDLLNNPGPTTAILYMPKGPFFLVAAVGCLILCLEYWVEFFHNLSQGVKK